MMTSRVGKVGKRRGPGCIGIRPGRRGRMLHSIVSAALVALVVPSGTASAATLFTAVGSVTNAVTSTSGTIRYDGSFSQTYLGYSGGKDQYSYTMNASITENVVVPEWVIKAITAKLIADLSPQAPAPSPPPYPPSPAPRSVASFTGSNFTGTFAVNESAVTMSGSFTSTPTAMSILYSCTFNTALPSFTGALAGSFTANGTLQPKTGTGATETTAMTLSTSPMVLSIQDVLPIGLSIDVDWDASYGHFTYGQTIDAAFNLTEATGSWSAAGLVDIVSIPEIDVASAAAVFGIVGAAMFLVDARTPRGRRRDPARACG